MSTGGKRIPGRYYTKPSTVQGTGGAVGQRNPDFDGVLYSLFKQINLRTGIGLVSEIARVIEGINERI